jgi:hypothetical protein
MAISFKSDTPVSMSSWDSEGDVLNERARNVRREGLSLDKDIQTRPHPQAAWMASWGAFRDSLQQWVKEVEGVLAADGAAHALGTEPHDPKVTDSVRKSISNKAEAIDQRREEWTNAFPAVDPLPELTVSKAVDLKLGPLTISPRNWDRARVVKVGVGIAAGTALAVVGFRWWKGRQRA